MTRSLRSINTVVLHQHRPSLLPGPGQPLGIGNGLVGGNSIDLGQGVQSQPDVPQKRRHLPTAQATVEEQLRQTIRVHCPHGQQTSQPMGVPSQAATRVAMRTASSSWSRGTRTPRRRHRAARRPGRARARRQHQTFRQPDERDDRRPDPRAGQRSKYPAYPPPPVAQRGDADSHGSRSRTCSPAHPGSGQPRPRCTAASRTSRARRHGRPARSPPPAPPYSP